MIFGFPTLHAQSGDSMWAKVSLLAHCEGADGSLVVTDSSSYADSKTVTAGNGLAISTTTAKFGSASLKADRRGPTPASWTSTRFNRPTGSALTIEGWFKSTAKVAATQAPNLFYLQDNLGNEVARVSQYSTVNQVECRFGTLDTATQHNYTPDAGGWTFLRLRIKTNDVYELWVNTTLAKTYGPFGGASGSWTFMLGGGITTDPTALTCYLDEWRVTQDDRGAVSAVPTEQFPTGPL